jgi:hypothetical protein
MDDVGQEKCLKILPEMMLSLLSFKFYSNLAIVASTWPLTRKKAWSLSAFASFVHNKIIHTRLYKVKS